MTGGAGDDTYSVDDAGDLVIEAAGAGIDQVVSALGVYTLAESVEELIAAGSGMVEVAFSGNALGNLIRGVGYEPSSGIFSNDTLSGFGGTTCSRVSPATTCSTAATATIPCTAGSPKLGTGHQRGARRTSTARPATTR